MTKTITLAAIAACTLAAAIAASSGHAAAQNWFERDGKTLPGGGIVRYDATCSKPGQKSVYGCSFAEKKAMDLLNQKYLEDKTQQEKKKADALRRQQEMDSEARAYRKMQDDRKRNAPTTEHCYMKSGRLECKPA